MREQTLACRGLVLVLLGWMVVAPGPARGETVAGGDYAVFIQTPAFLSLIDASFTSEHIFFLELADTFTETDLGGISLMSIRVDLGAPPDLELLRAEADGVALGDEKSIFFMLGNIRLKPIGANETLLPISLLGFRTH